MDLKLTTRSHEVLTSASDRASTSGHRHVEPAHLLVALLDAEDGLAVALLRAAGLDPAGIRTSAASQLARIPSAAIAAGGAPTLGHGAFDALNQASEAARRRDQDYISTEHVLIGLAGPRAAAGPADVVDLLAAAGATPHVLASALESLSGEPDVEGTTRAAEPSTAPGLAAYGIDLTEQARTGRLDPVVGRDTEIRRLVQVLSRRSKNNPVLIGEPGVGKTAVVEGLAQRIVAGDVPASLRGRRLVGLDLGAMVAGAKYRGDFEERLKGVVEEILASDGQVVAFLDELHTVVGAGSGGDGAMDAGNLLKPLLARGELRLVGATTPDEFRDRIEKDPALERRFQQVHVGEPSVEDTIGILRGLKQRYEAHHKVSLSDAALVAAATLSDRYLSGRQLPDKAIDLVDEAASRLRMEIDSSPEEIDDLRRQLDRMRLEEMALTREADAASRVRLERLRADRADRAEQLAALTATWEAEKDGLNRVGELRERLDTLRTAFERAYRDGDWAAASRLQHQEIPAVERSLDEASSGERSDPTMVSEEVGPDDVAEVIATWTGIPAGRLLEGETEKLLRMEEAIGARIIGQASGVTAVSFAVRRSRAGVSDPDRPTGSFLFLGPSGVGKTELAKALAGFLFDDERAMVRIDMSEYGEKHSVARLIGAPPGYVGYEQGGQLTEAVRRRPYSVVLLDEVEKAHPEIFDVLLQVLDDGRLTDGQGRTVDFRSTILVLTSNLGSVVVLDPDVDPPARRGAVLEVVRSAFKPEFLNRLDEMVVFDPLGTAELSRIVDLHVASLAKRLADRRLTIEVTSAAREWLAREGYDPAYGARPLRRLVQREIGDRLATGLLDGSIQEDDLVEVLVDPGPVAGDVGAASAGLTLNVVHSVVTDAGDGPSASDGTTEPGANPGHVDAAYGDGLDGLDGAGAAGSTASGGDPEPDQNAALTPGGHHGGTPDLRHAGMDALA
ncbi:MAG: ATP-dependent Clp protease ATP-binding subunit [Dermatophilaceae bacterium]